MRKHWFALISIVGIAVCSFHALAQPHPSLPGITKLFDTYRKSHLQEKLFVHIDRSFYITGETIWFSAYCSDGTLHQLLKLSQVAYIEIVDGNNVPLAQTKILLNQGRGSGSLFLSSNLASGYYMLRAYTSWMKNSDPSYFFHQVITIVNTLKDPGASEKQKVVPDFSIQFFPEGGQLVSGLESKVAFHAVDRSGKGIDFSATLLKENGDTILHFKPLKWGIGHFTFTPSAASRYTALVQDCNGKTKTFSLPSIERNGWVMKLTEEGKMGIRVAVAGTPATGDQVYYLIHARNSVVESGEASFQNGQCSFQLPKNKLQDGINHITLFNKEFTPLCERLYFKLPERILNLLAETDLREYGPRKKVALKIRAPESDLSLAIFQNDSLTNGPINIISWLYLTSDLKGVVQSPSSYFEGSPEENTLALDNLMLTHGWRRFRWEEIMKPTPADVEYLPEINGHMIKVKVLNSQNLPAPAITTYLSSPSPSIRPFITTTDRKGIAIIELKAFGLRKLIVQLSPADSLHHPEVLSPFASTFADYFVPNLTVSPRWKTSLLSRSIAMQVNDIYFEDKMYNFSSPQADTLPFYGKPDEQYLLDDYTRFPVMEEVMREYIKAVWVRKKNDNFRFMVLDNPHASVFDSAPLILLDGVPLFNANEIMELDPLKVKRLDVMARKYFLGPKAYTGIVSFVTYTGDGGGFPWNSRAVQLNYEGFQLHREFYSPSYDGSSVSRIPDKRTLLFWKPDVIVSKKGETDIEFFTSDVPGNYSVIIQGIGKDGSPGFATIDFKVTANHN